MPYTSARSTNPSKSSTTRPSVPGMSSSSRQKEPKTAEHKSAMSRSKTYRPTTSRPITTPSRSTPSRATSSRSTSSGSTSSKPTTSKAATFGPGTSRSTMSRSTTSKSTPSNPRRLSRLVSRLTTSRSTSASAKPTTGSGSTTASSPKLESKEPPKSEAERQIGTLEAVADGLFGPSRHRGRYDTPYDGRTMALLSINHCLAVQDPSSSRVTRFAEQYAEVKTWYLETIDFEVLKDELWQLFARLDELFFFGLLSRKVDSPMGRRPVLIVEIIDDYDKKCHYAGRYLPKEGKIRLWLRDYRHPENRRSFRVILGTLLHELTHAYLGLADKKHENHGKWVADCKSHGEYFWALLQYLAETIMKFTDSPSWREEMDVIDAERKKIEERKHSIWGCRTQ